MSQRRRPPQRLSATLALGLLAPSLVVAAAVPATAAATTITVTTTVDGALGGTVPSGSDVACAVGAGPGAGGACTLRAAVQTANDPSSGPVDTIVLPAGTYTLDIVGPGEDDGATGDLDLRTSVTLRGAGADTTIIDAGGDGGLGDRILDVLPGHQVALEGLTLTGGRLAGTAGVSRGGGAIAVRDGATSLTLTDVDLIDNAAGGGGSIGLRGGALFVRGGVDLTVTGGRIADNRTGPGGDGGGVALDGGASDTVTATFVGVTLEGNAANPEQLSTSGGDGGAITTIFEVDLTVVGSHLLDNVAGEDGGAITVQAGGMVGTEARLTLTDTRLAGNQALDGRGGGVHLTAQGFAENVTATVTDVTLADNRARVGGGIHLARTDAQIVDATVTGNTAVVQGGGLMLGGSSSTTITGSTIADNEVAGITLGGDTVAYGGGVAANSPLEISNSTISGNSLPNNTGDLDVDGNLDDGGAALWADGSQAEVTLRSVTVVGNRSSAVAGLYASSGSATIELQDTLLADNLRTDGSSANCATGPLQQGSRPTSLGGNLEDGDDCRLAGADDLTDAGDPMVGPLAENGGPTRTHALLPGSPAIDAGTSQLPVDQRGEPRPVGAGPDVGAFEADVVAADGTAINSTADVALDDPTDTSCDTGRTVTTDDAIGGSDGQPECTLRAAVQAANNAGVPTTLDLPAATFDLTLAPAGDDDAATGDLDITVPLTLRGASSDTTIIDGGWRDDDHPDGPAEGFGDRLFEVADDASLTLHDLRIVGGRTAAGQDGGAILTGEGPVTLRRVVATQNRALNDVGVGGLGGVIRAVRGDVALEDVTLRDNRASQGAGVSTVFGDVTGTDVVAEDNTVTSIGGAFNVQRGTLALDGARLAGNRARGGGAIVAFNGEVSLADVTVVDNHAEQDGGAIRINGGADVTIDGDSRLAGNTAGDDGGAIATLPPQGIAEDDPEGTVTLTSTTLDGNEAGRDGGAIRTSDGPIVLRNVTLSGNAAATGGAIATDTGDVDADSVTFADNRAEDGGGANLDVAGVADLALRNTLLDVRADDGPACALAQATVTSGGANLDRDATCGLDAADDLPDVDPRLGPLMVDDGRTAPTHGLTDPSPAIDTGDTDLTVDQRGEPRPFGDGDDIGAVERQRAVPDPEPEPELGPELGPADGAIAELVARCDAAPDTFGDDDGSVHERSIDCLDALGLLRGFDDGTVRPSRDVTRGQTASVLMRAVELITEQPRTALCPDGGDRFRDEDATHGDAAACLARLGIVEGFADHTFRPGDPLERAQAASLVRRLTTELGVSLPVGEALRFADVAPGSVHADAIGALAGAGILEGYDRTTFGPTDHLQRGQLASVIDRWLRALADG